MKSKRWGADRPPSPGKRGASRLVDQLMGKLRPGRAATVAANLAPPGQRSGEGSDSIAPYLSQTRKTRPAPLE